YSSLKPILYNESVKIRFFALFICCPSVENQVNERPSQFLAMKSYTLFAATVALIATVAFAQGSAAKNLKRDFSELTSFERLLFQFTRPDTYNNLSGRSGSKSPGINSEYSPIDFLNFDLPTLALQLSKSGSTFLPTVHFEYGFYYCYMGICIGFLQQYDYNKPEIRNANLTKANTHINDTNLEFDFQIPDLQIVMEDFFLHDEDLITGDIQMWRGLSLLISNYTLQLSANLEYVADVGIQLSNVSMNFAVGDFKLRRENGTHILPDGTTEEYGSVEREIASYMNEDWITYGEEVTASAQAWLNCFLSNGRNGDAQCEELLNDNLQPVNFMQLLQTIGLGIARNQEKLSIMNPQKIQDVLTVPHFLPSFPFPTMQSVLLELPTLLLQLGKVFFSTEAYPVSGFPMSYDYIRQNCSVGGCRDVHEQMFLPEFTVGGIIYDKLQVEITPDSFSYSIKVPEVYLDAPTLQSESTDVESGFREFYLGMKLSVVDAAFAISGDYSFEKGVGLQVSDLGLTLRLGELQMSFPQYFTTQNGEQSEIVEYNVDIAPQIMEIWNSVDENGVTFERQYEEYIQNVINAYLLRN
ncbi:hypothetical protein Ocin01_12097, partial [Orchesella cincta]